MSRRATERHGTHISVVANPAAGRGRVSRKLERIRAAFAKQGVEDIRLTSEPGEEESLARAAITNGATTIVAVGGDGTVSRVANAILSSGSSCRLGLVPAGTGNDFAKTLGMLPLSIESIAALAAGQSVARMDVGKVDDLYFINGVGFGMDPAILADTLKVKRLSGNAVYIVTALRNLFSYSGITVSADWASTGQSPQGKKVMMLTVSVGRYFGGAFKIAPAASACDGLFDVHTFIDGGKIRRVQAFLAVLRGTHAALPEVDFEQRSSVRFEFDAAPEMEVDGELRTAKSEQVLLECIPGALALVAAPGFPL